MNMHWPQIVWLALVMIRIGVVTARHGQTKIETYNVWESLVSLPIAAALLYFGGFFAGTSP